MSRLPPPARPRVAKACPANTRLWVLDSSRRAIAANAYRAARLRMLDAFEAGKRIDQRFCRPFSGQIRCPGPVIAAWCQLPDGVQQGPYWEWWDSGAPAVRGQYVNGAERGVWVYWNESGAVVRRVDYRARRRTAARLQPRVAR